VRDDFRYAGVFPVGVKLLDLFFAIRFAGPLARGFGKNLNRVAFDLFAVEKGVADAAGDRTCGRPTKGPRVFVLGFIMSRNALTI
jgi:hypothetical protein